MTEEEIRDKDKPVSWRPSKEAQELLDKVKGGARKKLLDKLMADEAKRQREVAAGPCEQETLDMIDTYEKHYIPYFEKQLEEDSKRLGYAKEAAKDVDYDRKQINWAKWWIRYYKTRCICGCKREHKIEECSHKEGEYAPHKPEWIKAANSYDPEAEAQAKRAKLLRTLR